jgi:hypothetical protein
MHQFETKFISLYLDEFIFIVFNLFLKNKIDKNTLDLNFFFF